MSNSFHIFREDYVAGGILLAALEGHADIATITYLSFGENLWVVDETEIAAELKGKGAGQVLAEQLIADARANGLTLLPFCPYFLALSKQRSDWHDVVKMPLQERRETWFS